MLGSIEDEINRAEILGETLESLVFNNVKDAGFPISNERDDLVIQYWSIVFDFDKGILTLLHHGFLHSAFALIRPIVEAIVRECVAMTGPKEEVQNIRKGRYKLNYQKAGAQIDAKLGTSPLLDNYLKEANSLLNSLAHSGAAHLARAFDGSCSGANFTDSEMKGLIGNSASACFLATVVIATHFGFLAERDVANRIWTEYGKRQD